MEEPAGLPGRPPCGFGVVSNIDGEVCAAIKSSETVIEVTEAPSET